MKRTFLSMLASLAVAFNVTAQTPAPTSAPAAPAAPVPAAPVPSPSPAPAVASPAAPTIGLPPQAPKLQSNKIQPRTDHVFSALVLATTAPTTEAPAAANAELAAFAPKLKAVFGYNQFELVGAHMELMDHPDEQWLVPSKLFSLSVKSKAEKPACYLLKLQLFQENKLLAGFDAKLSPESPIFIRGPLYGKGQLIIVVDVRR